MFRAQRVRRTDKMMQSQSLPHEMTASIATARYARSLRLIRVSFAKRIGLPLIRKVALSTPVIATLVLLISLECGRDYITAKSAKCS